MPTTLKPGLPINNSDPLSVSDGEVYLSANAVTINFWQSTDWLFNPRLTLQHVLPNFLYYRSFPEVSDGADECLPRGGGSLIGFFIAEDILKQQQSLRIASACRASRAAHSIVEFRKAAIL